MYKMEIEDLKQIGFKFASKWQLGTNNDKYDNGLKDEILSKPNFIYCFVISDKIVYIGKSDRLARARIRNGWARNKKKDQIGKSTTGGHFLAEAIDKYHQNVEIWIWFPENVVKDVLVILDPPKNIFEFSQKELEDAALNGILRLIEKKLIQRFHPIWNGNS